MKKFLALLLIVLTMIIACDPTDRNVVTEEPEIENVPDTIYASTEGVTPEEGNW